MYGQGNYPSQFRPPPFQQSQPNQPPPPPPPFQQSQPNQPPPPPFQQSLANQPPPPSYHQALPGQQPPPNLHNPPHSLTHQAPPGPPPPQYQHNVAQPQQAGPSYLHPPPQPFLPPPPPPPIQANSPIPPIYSQHNASYSHHHACQPLPPPRMFPPPPPPPHSQGQVLYRTPTLAPYGIQHVSAPPPPPPPSGFVPITPSPYAPYGQLPTEVCPPSLPPPPPPPPPPSSPPPLPPSPPPPASPTIEVIGVPMVPSPHLPAHDVADAAVAPVINEAEICENEGPIVKEEPLVDLPTFPPKPADEEVVQNIEMLCQSIANSGPDTENLACKNEAGNPKFAFLFGGESGSDAAIGHDYFQWMKRKYLSEKDPYEQNVSPIDSDMDMEDDVSRADVDKRIDESSKGSAVEIVSLCSEVLAVKNSPPSFHEGEEDKASAFIEDVSPVRVSPDTAEELSEKNLLGSVKLPTEDSSVVKVSLTPVGGGALEAPRIYVKDGSPFRLIQDYASDDSEEDDKETAEDMNADGPAAAGSPVKHEKLEPPSSFRPNNEYGEEIGSKIQNDAAQISPLTMTGDCGYSGSLPQEATCQNVTSLASVDHTKEVLNFQDDEKYDNKILKCETAQKNETLDGVNMNAEDMAGKHQLGGNTNQDPVNLDVDEFGRLVRKGASDSESDEMQYSGRHGKRGRNTSRSRSPQESRWRHRSRSPRRREKRSRSHSRSPKRPRSKSPPAYRRINVSSRRDRDRDRDGDRNQPPECLNFNRGRCFRGVSCRFLHHDVTQHMSRHQDYHDVPRDSANCDKHDTSPSFNLDKSAATEMDIEQIINAPINDAKSAVIHTTSPEQYGAVILSVNTGERTERDEPDNISIGKNDVRELQATDLVTPEGKPHMEKLHDRPSPHSPIEEDMVQPPLQLSHTPQADSALIESSSAASTQPSQITPLTKISELKEPEGRQCSPEGLGSHPLPSPTAQAPAIVQTSSNQSSCTQSYAHDLSNLNPSLPSKEFPAPKFSGPDVNFQMSQQVPPGPPGPPPPPSHFLSDNPSTHFAPHLRPVLSSGYQTQPPNLFSHLHSQSLPPPNPGWPNIPPAPSFLAMPPRRDLNPMIGPYQPGEMSRPLLVGEFHSQPFRPVDSSLQPPFHMKEFIRMPLPHDHPFGREDRFLHPPLHDGPRIMPNSQRDYHLQTQSSLHEEARMPLPGQGFSFMSSLSQGGEVHGHPLSLPREIIPNRLHSFPGENVNLRPFPTEEFSTSAVKDLPYSHRPPLYGTQHPGSISYPPNLSTSGLVESTLRRYPSSFLDNKLSHYNPFASTFEQVPTSSKFVSGVSGREYDMHSSKYDSSFSSGHVSAGVVESRIRASSPDLKRAGEHILPRAGLHSEEKIADVQSDSQKQLGKNSAGDAYDPLFDSIEPSPKDYDQVGGPNPVVSDIDETTKSGSLHKPASLEDSKKKGSTGAEHKLEVDEIGEVATDAEAGAVENASPQPLDERDWSPDLPLDMGNATAGEIEIDQVQSPGKSKKSKDSRSMKLFKIALADFVKEVLKPSWRQGNMSKEAFKTIVKKTVDKVSGAMPSHQIPKSQAKINQYVESSQRKLTKLVMGYVDKYVKM